LERREDFLATEILGRVRESLARGRGLLVERILSDLYDARIAPALTARQGRRTTIGQLEAEVAGIVADYEAETRESAGEAIRREVASLSLLARERLKVWLETFGLKLPDRPSTERASDGDLALGGLAVGDNLVHPLILVVGGLVSVVTSTILAALFGGAGVAMVAHGPAGLLAGVVGGVVLSGAGLIYGQDWLKKRFKERPLPGLVMRMIASESMSRKIRRDFEAKLVERLTAIGEDFEGRLGQAVRAMIDEEIENLGIVNIL
jgi:hypothetical protein